MTSSEGTITLWRFGLKVLRRLDGIGANVLATASDRSMEPSRIQAKQYAEHIHAIDCIYSIYIYGK
jgi:hypothetical protein